MNKHEPDRKMLKIYSNVYFVITYIWQLNLHAFLYACITNRTCTIVPSTSPCGSGLEKQRPNYYISQTLPNGFYVTDGIVSLIEANSQTNSECRQILKGFLCGAAYAPCDNKTMQPLEMCPASCQLIRSIIDGFLCQNELASLRTFTNNQDLLNEILNRFNCSVPTSYFYGDASLGFSNATCYNVTDMKSNFTSGKSPCMHFIHWCKTDNRA